MIAIDRYKTSDTTIDGTIMTGTEMIEVRTITTIVMIEITPPATIGGERINGETMMIGAGKDAIIKNGMLEKRNSCHEPAKDYQRDLDRSITSAQSEQQRIEEPNRPGSGFQLGNAPKAESNNTWKVYFYYCRQDGHYSNQCPMKSNEKRPEVNMVVAEVADI